MKTILVPTDFSNHAHMAIETAINITRATQAELILLHVVDQPSNESYSVEGEVSREEDFENRIFIMKMIEKSKMQLDKTAELARRAGVTVRTELRLGNPFHGMYTIITNHDVDLVVMGTEGHSKLDKLFIGSNTEKVMRHAKCAVLTIHRKPSTDTFRNIVYATSMKEDEDRFSKVVAEMQELFNATLHLVRINTPDRFETDSVQKRDMEEYAKRLGLQNYTLNVFNDHSAQEGILQFAESINADLIAMATHGRTGLAHMLYGSVAEEVSSHARRPVLTAVV